jgi:hypothetical protein
MNKKLLQVALCCLSACLIGSLLALGWRGPVPAQATSPRPQASVIPDSVLYKHLFRHVAAFKKQAEQAVQQGKDGTPMRAFFKHKAQLTDEQARILEEIADDCDREVRLQDAKAKTVIDAYKAQYPGGKVPHGETPKPPPAELKAMTQERNAIILRARDRLRASFGEAEFRRFDGFVKLRIAPNIDLVKPDQATLDSQPDAQ